MTCDEGGAYRWLQRPDVFSDGRTKHRNTYNKMMDAAAEGYCNLAAVASICDAMRYLSIIKIQLAIAAASRIK